MIPQKFIFKCENCGYEEVRTIADVRPDINELKPCYKCKGKMFKTDKKEKNNFLNKLRRIFKQNIPSKNKQTKKIFIPKMLQ